MTGRHHYSRLITDTFRNDLAVVARLGGDEFLMVIKSTPENSHSLAEEVSQRLLTQIALPIELPGNMTAQAGCSLGAAVWPEHGMDIQQVIRHADSALYQAKHQGKHRLVIYRPDQ